MVLVWRYIYLLNVFKYLIGYNYDLNMFRDNLKIKDFIFKFNMDEKLVFKILYIKLVLKLIL